MSRRARGGFLATLDSFAFAIFRVALRVALTLYFRLSVRGDRTLDHGPAIVVANHQSFLDSLLVGVAVRPRVRFVMTELFACVRGLRWFFRWNRVIIMREDSSNREMFKQSLAALQNGEVLGIFPEGTISLDGSLSEFQPGALSMALRERVPIVPVALVGAHRALHRSMWFPRPRKIRVEVGTPIPPDELFPRSASRTEALEIGARLLQHRVEELSRRAELRGRSPVTSVDTAGVANDRADRG